MRAIEICAGAGGQALGLEQAGFDHVALVEIDPWACETLRLNRPFWNVIEGDVKDFSAQKYRGVDLLAGGVPCPPFTIAGKQLGRDDDRDLFMEAMRLVEECGPKAVMLENVRGLFCSKFDSYRAAIAKKLEKLGYAFIWDSVNASDFGVPQSRERSILVALRTRYADFEWPVGGQEPPPTVGELLLAEMASNGWKGAEEWARGARGLAPTLVGGSKRHGGGDLGPTRAKLAWKKLGVDANGIADSPPSGGFAGAPRLTVGMASLIQGFPPDWRFAGKKTAAYKQVGNAFPPAVACAFGKAIFKSLSKAVSKEAKASNGENRRRTKKIAEMRQNVSEGQAAENLS
jgi:DNA (cytosine-5)-methyltransferase 1